LFFQVFTWQTLTFINKQYKAEIYGIIRPGLKWPVKMKRVQEVHANRTLENTYIGHKGSA
jgi:hypothetical protein